MTVLTRCLMGSLLALLLTSQPATSADEESHRLPQGGAESYPSKRTTSPEMARFQQHVKALVNSGNLSGARDAVDAAIGDPAVNADVAVLARLYSGMLYLAEDKADSAIAALEECRRLAATDEWRYALFSAAALNQIAMAQLKSGKRKEALASLRQLIEEFPDPVEDAIDFAGPAFEDIRHDMAAQGKTEEFLELCKGIAKEFPGKLAGYHAMLELGRHEASLASSHWDAAIGYLEPVMDASATSPDASREATQILARSLRPPNVRDVCDTCHKVVPPDEEFVVTLKDGTRRVFCGVRHGVPYALEMKDYVAAVQVVDCVRNILIDARSAFYAGPLSKVGGYGAYGSRLEAQHFQGGKILTYDELVKEIVEGREQHSGKPASE